MTIRFMKHYVTDGAVKARVFYSPGQIYRDPAAGEAGGLVQCVTLYARGYDRALGKIFADRYINDTDLMTDYFDQGRVRIYTDDPLYPAVMARIAQNAADSDEREAAKRGGFKSVAALRAWHAEAEEALNDPNYVGARCHY